MFKIDTILACAMVLNVVLVLTACPALGNPPGQLSAQVDVDYRSYLRSVADRVKTHWHDKTNKKVDVQFNILQNGKIAKLHVTAPSGDDKVDSAALKAVVKSGRFSELPAGSNQFIKVQLKFNFRDEDRVHPGILD